MGRPGLPREPGQRIHRVRPRDQPERDLQVAARRAHPRLGERPEPLLGQGRPLSHRVRRLLRAALRQGARAVRGQRELDRRERRGHRGRQAAECHADEQVHRAGRRARPRVAPHARQGQGQPLRRHGRAGQRPLRRQDAALALEERQVLAHAQGVERFLRQHRSEAQGREPRRAAVPRGPAVRNHGRRRAPRRAGRVRVRRRRARALQRRRLPATARVVPAPWVAGRCIGRRCARGLRGRHARPGGGRTRGRRVGAGGEGAEARRLQGFRCRRGCGGAIDAAHDRQAASGRHRRLL
ncbi:hypothetical protein L963_1501 [Leuconostoc mesenteroides subsp. cremoris T26]|nr:hypothetical protein L963_1501 [Leuconostoc mesenteroides subsp. cremoris T26]